MDLKHKSKEKQRHKAWWAGGQGVYQGGLGNGWMGEYDQNALHKIPNELRKTEGKKKTQNTKLFVQGVDGYTCKRWGTQGEKPKRTVNKH